NLKISERFSRRLEWICSTSTCWVITLQIRPQTRIGTKLQYDYRNIRNSNCERKKVTGSRLRPLRPFVSVLPSQEENEIRFRDDVETSRLLYENCRCVMTDGVRQFTQRSIFGNHRKGPLHILGDRFSLGFRVLN